MDAYQIADKLEKHEFDAMEYGFDKPLLLAATILRQQAGEINNLKQWQNRMLDVIKNLEAQVYGGTTK